MKLLTSIRSIIHKKMDKPEALFIVGHKRSGSTLLTHLMNLHPNIFISHETDIIWILYQLQNNLEIQPYRFDGPIGINRALKNHSEIIHSQTTIREKFTRLLYEEMRQGSKRLQPMNKKNLMYIGDKKPFQQIDPKVIGFIKKHFPEARMIHLIRHPLSVLNSCKKFGASNDGGFMWKDVSKAEILRRWTLVETWVQQEKEKSEIPFLDIRYEDMTNDISKELKRLFDFLDLKYNKEVLRSAQNMVQKNNNPQPSFPLQEETLKIMKRYGYQTG